MRQFEAIVEYLRHRMRTQSKYRIHSPFVYQFFDKVLTNRDTHIEYRIVNRLRKELTFHSRFIKRKDFGANGNEFPSNQRFVRVGDLVRSSGATKKKGEFLFRLTRLYRPNTILELGTSLGLSAMYFALAAPSAKIITIEGCIDSAKIARENFEKAQLNNIEVIIGSFEEKLTEALEMVPSPDLVYFDGNHREEATLSYFETCLQHIHPGSVFLFENIHWSKGMASAWKTICKHPRVKVSIDLYNTGLLFFREELSKEDFILRF